MANTAIRIGILGAGAMATAHAAAYATMADVTVVGVFSRDLTRARRVAAVCQAEPFTDATALIRNAAVDAVDVCLPSAIHHLFVVPALHEGKHVFCETPLALSLDEARQMLDAARRANRLLQVGLLMRSLGAYEHVKAAASSGVIVRQRASSLTRASASPRPNGARTAASSPRRLWITATAAVSVTNTTAATRKNCWEVR